MKVWIETYIASNIMMNTKLKCTISLGLDGTQTNPRLESLHLPFWHLVVWLLDTTISDHNHQIKSKHKTNTHITHIAFFATSPQTSFLTGKNMMTTVLTKEWKNINKNGFLFQKRTGYPNMVASQLRHCLCLAKHSARWRCSVFCYHNNACYPCNKPASLANYTNYWEQHCIGSSVGLVSTSF